MPVRTTEDESTRNRESPPPESSPKDNRPLLSSVFCAALGAEKRRARPKGPDMRKWGKLFAYRMPFQRLLNEKCFPDRNSFGYHSDFMCGMNPEASTVCR